MKEEVSGSHYIHGRRLIVFIPRSGKVHISTENELANKTVRKEERGKAGLIKETMYPS